jgi:hypothetical protein
MSLKARITLYSLSLHTHSPLAELTDCHFSTGLALSFAVFGTIFGFMSSIIDGFSPYLCTSPKNPSQDAYNPTALS